MEPSRRPPPAGPAAGSGTRLTAPHELVGAGGLSGAELSWGWPFGQDPGTPAPTGADRARRTADGVEHPRDVLESLLLDAARQGPVVVSFSGGRDSSALLALAMAVTRREGLPPPVALTSRYGDDPDADETSWQELVVRHLGVEDWIVLDATGTADALGPWATEVVGMVGHNVFPPGCARLGAQATHARGGTLVSGEPGDWVLGAHRMTVVQHVVRRRGLVGRRVWAAAAEAAAPSAVRALLARRRGGGPVWLTPSAAALRRGALVAEARADPLRWDAAVRSLPGRRFVRIGFPTRTAVARAYGATLLDPFGSRRFLDAYAAWGGARGMASRTAAMRLLCGDLLPEEILTRRTKATFNRQVFGPATRVFAEAWTGAGVDDALVDAELLRREWLSDRPDGRSLSLLQEVWSASRPGARAGRR